MTGRVRIRINQVVVEGGGRIDPRSLADSLRQQIAAQLDDAAGLSAPPTRQMPRLDAGQAPTCDAAGVAAQVAIRLGTSLRAAPMPSAIGPDGQGGRNLPRGGAR
jgi:hypothetical protein